MTTRARARTQAESWKLRGTATLAAMNGCANDCAFAKDGDCDDGGIGSEFAHCDFGDDCTDCGLRSLWAPVAPPRPLTEEKSGNDSFDSRFYFGLGVLSTCMLIALVTTCLASARWLWKRRQRLDHEKTYTTIVEAELAASKKGAVANRLLNTPTCEWHSTGQYACFLSHYKREAGSDARCDPCKSVDHSRTSNCHAS
eukprot:2438016-Prymnesium_polylepis.1